MSRSRIAAVFLAVTGSTFVAFGTTVASMLLFLASIYYARYLGLREQD